MPVSPGGVAVLTPDGAQATVQTRDAGSATITATAAPGIAGTVQVNVTPLRFTDVSAGPSCAITGAGALYCWGSRSTDGVSTIVPRPYLARNDRIYRQISDSGACLLDDQGNVRCGDSVTDGAYTFIAGSVCMLDETGKAFCWGTGTFGQIGHGDRTNAPSPTAVSGERSYATLAGSMNHRCGLTASGELYCWGLNSSGQLGLGTSAGPDYCGMSGTIWYSMTPRPVTGGLTFRVIGTGSRHTCGVATDGSVWCWGDNVSGQLGNGTTASSSVPVQVQGVANLKAIDGGNEHTCGIAQDDSVWCWGDNSRGQLGTGSRTSSLVAVQVPGGLRATVVSAGGAVSCAITPSGSTYCWGANDVGAIGDGTSGTDRTSPTRVLGT